MERPGDASREHVHRDSVERTRKTDGLSSPGVSSRSATGTAFKRQPAVSVFGRYKHNTVAGRVSDEQKPQDPSLRLSYRTYILPWAVHRFDRSPTTTRS